MPIQVGIKVMYTSLASIINDWRIIPILSRRGAPSLIQRSDSKIMQDPHHSTCLQLEKRTLWTKKVPNVLKEGEKLGQIAREPQAKLGQLC